MRSACALARLCGLRRPGETTAREAGRRETFSLVVIDNKQIGNRMRKPKTETEKLLDAGRKLLELSSDRQDAEDAHDAFIKWEKRVKTFLQKIPNNSSAIAEWTAMKSSPLVKGDNIFESEYSWNSYSKVIKERIVWLGNFTIQGAKKNHIKDKNKAEHKNKIFIVHGHNHHLKESLARYIEKLNLLPIILHEQANKNKTIIEKFQEHATVDAAVVLLTKDDMGYGVSKGEASKQHRARQNVIFEMGYFLGRLGREKVITIYEPGVEIPSDYAGILYIEYDPNEAWKYRIAKELKSIGIPVDFNNSI